MSADRRDAPEIVAHRGDPVHEIENTRAAILRARDDGATTIEIDVRLSSDGLPVVLHDASTQRLWGRDRPAQEQTSAELTEIGIPLLTTALETAAPARLLIDLPDDDPAPELARATVRVAAEAGIRPAFCGGPAAMREVRAADPGAEIWLTWKDDAPLDEEVVAALRPHGWNPPHHLVDASSIARARALGLRVTCWTVDDVERARELAALGVDAITSNRAAELRRARR